MLKWLKKKQLCKVCGQNFEMLSWMWHYFFSIKVVSLGYFAEVIGWKKKSFKECVVIIWKLNIEKKNVTKLTTKTI